MLQRWAEEASFGRVGKTVEVRGPVNPERQWWRVRAEVNDDNAEGFKQGAKFKEGARNKAN
jgi:hypothetical protein